MTDTRLAIHWIYNCRKHA